MEWTQDAQGKDIYADTGDLVYFPRQMEIEPGARKLVRVGAKAPAGATERNLSHVHRGAARPVRGAAQGAGLGLLPVRRPHLLAPAVPRVQADVGEPTLDKGTSPCI
jgi:fimbrial chaperone protein